jgi:carboxypeptidase C (cathepsin A)
VFSANGYFDAVTPFFQKELTLASMPIDPSLHSNITIRKYPSGQRSMTACSPTVRR